MSGGCSEVETVVRGIRDASFTMFIKSTDAANLITELAAENAKLRELCADMWRDIPKTESCGWDMSTNTCTGSGECIGECSYWYRMHDLGIEVTDI